MNTYAIDVHGLTKRFGQRTIVDNINIRIKSGTICGFLGPNGSGKTTTIRMLCGLLEADGGQGQCLGHDFRREAAAIRRQTGYMTQKFGWYEDLTVRENLDFIARLFAVSQRKQAVSDALERHGLQSRAHHLAGSLSGGWKQRLALAMSLIHRPRLLLLDEPTAGVDPKARREFWDEIHQLADHGITVMVSTHYMDEAERCHELIYLAYGQILARGSESDIIRAQNLDIWQLAGNNARAAAEQLQTHPAVTALSAFGNRYHITTTDPAALQQALAQTALPGVSLTRHTAGLEDIFIHLLENRADTRFGEQP